MKKRVLKLAAFLTVLALVSLSTLQTKEGGEVDVTLANMEALAQNEGPNGFPCAQDCPGVYCGSYLGPWWECPWW